MLRPQRASSERVALCNFPAAIPGRVLHLFLATLGDMGLLKRTLPGSLSHRVAMLVMNRM